ncbi:unnamed protein product [Bursaphelenchus xylophilus]|uniref:(pine wood nematode) hypothetical protein n=1 Tax=Bursaphelenchus xylophilus TaxID=6326 RepID=A0A1I7S8K4_BURXY|nr:unnamed protein product [Bursaphelenchus xylophilus]CAG9089581.1 unnamed protein product [Bursaphelenchus xylophilus]
MSAMRACTLTALCAVGLLVQVVAIPVDNGVVGEPVVECGPHAIEVTFQTQNPFHGRLYVKGRAADGDCSNEQIGRTSTGITLPFDACNVQRLRSLNPKGIFASTTVVISFHPIFVTKVDRVYHIQCFYMEAEKTVSQNLDVSDLTTALATHLLPMPVCRYEVLDGSPTGQPVQFAVVGQQVYHKWTCDTDTQNTFCMVVHTCFVDDGAGEKVELLDENGCAKDKFLLNNLEYPDDLNAGQEAHVFKYADRAQLFFQCQVALSLKDGATECARPGCAEPGNRVKRHLKSLPLDTLNSVDVASPEITVLDADLVHHQPEPTTDVCVQPSPVLFVVFVGAIALTILVIILLVNRRN